MMDNELHDTPIVYRLIDDTILEWLDSASASALASRSPGTDACKAIEELRHMRLGSPGSSVTPRIIKRLRDANLLKIREA